MSDPINGTEFIENPFNVTFSPFTDLFENFTGIGAVFWLFPLSIIAIALYMKTNNPSTVSLFMIVTGIFLSGSGMFIGAMDMALIYGIFTAIGFVALFVSTFWGQ